eukprot:5430412-Pyramimonas_sp.AAC.1
MLYICVLSRSGTTSPSSLGNCDLSTSRATSVSLGGPHVSSNRPGVGKGRRGSSRISLGVADRYCHARNLECALKSTPSNLGENYTSCKGWRTCKAPQMNHVAARPGCRGVASVTPYGRWLQADIQATVLTAFSPFTRSPVRGVSQDIARAVWVHNSAFCAYQVSRRIIFH